MEGRVILSNFKTDNKATVIKSVWTTTQTNGLE